MGAVFGITAATRGPREPGRAGRAFRPDAEPQLRGTGEVARGGRARQPPPGLRSDRRGAGAVSVACTTSASCTVLSRSAQRTGRLRTSCSNVSGRGTTPSPGASSPTSFSRGPRHNAPVMYPRLKHVGLSLTASTPSSHGYDLTSSPKIADVWLHDTSPGTWPERHMPRRNKHTVPDPEAFTEGGKFSPRTAKPCVGKVRASTGCSPERVSMPTQSLAEAAEDRRFFPSLKAWASAPEGKHL
jgi:hypothetical protein